MHKRSDNLGGNLKVFTAVIAVFFVTSSAFSQPVNATKNYSSADAVKAAIAKATTEHKGDNTNTIEPLLSIGSYQVNLEYRTGGTPPTVHKGQWEFIHVVKGSADLLEGGTLVDGNGPPNMIVGKSISGGSATRISEGDYVAIPSGTPHQFFPKRTPFIMMSVHIETPK
jgi:mannose-6-phosphate isomerase-like protein (cupin superfamily)